MASDIRKRIESLVRPEILSLTAYGVADPGDLIKLDAMENPYPWPQALKRDWAERLQQVAINRYPDPQATSLKPALRQVMGLPRDMEIMLGNGSDELIQIIMMALARPGATVLAPAPTFVMYEMTARFVGLEFISVPLNDNDFSLDVDAMLAVITQRQPALIFLAYPNNPTGNLYANSDIESILNAANGLVVIDEAYHAFSGRSLMARLAEHDNIVIMRTVSKLGLAGLRLGLLVGDKLWLTEFDKVRLPYNINSLTQASAEFALANIDFLEQQTANLRQARDALYDKLMSLDGIEVWHSHANFILFRVKNKMADAVFDGLRQRGVLIKNLDKSSPALKGCLRVTIGKPEENDAFLTALAEVV
jgi:histidinol-phosphate aminotransferase